MNVITITEKINLQNVLYLYSLNEEELFKYCKKDKDIKYYNSTINILADYIINGNDTNDKVYVKNNCNRYYCNNSLQLLQTDIRNFIYPDNTYDYDIKNCSPSIMLYLSKLNNLNHKHIQYYIDNRDLIIQKYNSTKKEIKEIINKLCNIDNPYKTNKIEIDDFINEFNFNKKILIDIYKNILPNKNYDEKTNPISSKYCEIYYYFESEIVQKVMNKYKENVICYMFDGFNTNKQLDINEINQITKEYGIEWINKPIETKFNYDKVINYDDIKKKLEKYIYKKFQLYDVSDTYNICEKYNSYISKTIKYCNDLWYVLDNKTNLWKNVKEVQPYFLKILRIGLNNAKDILDRKFEEAKEDSDCEDDLTAISEKIAKHMKTYSYIDKSSFCNQFKKNITEFITDDDFDDKLDSNTFYMAFNNGIVDMKTGIFRNGIYPSDYLTKTLDYPYIPIEDIDHEDIEFFKTEWKKILNYNDLHYDYFMKHLAYAFTGDSDKYQHFYFCVGQLAGNGKSSIFETLTKIFKCYVTNVNSELLQTDYTKKHKLMIKFKNHRIVYLNEMKKGKKIGSDTMKLISDGLSYDNEVLYGNTDTFKIKAKAFLLTNHMPDFDNLDQGVYRRYEHLQFDSEFDIKNKYKLKEDDYINKRFIADPDFSKKMIEKKYGLVHLILQYSKKTIETKLPEMPETFLEEKELMKSVNDELKDWLDSIILISEKQKIAKSEIIERCKIEKNLKLDSKTLLDIMKQLGHKDKYKKDVAKVGYGKGIWKGLELIPIQEKEDKKEDNNQNYNSDLDSDTD